MALTATFMMMSLVLYERIKDKEDDDLVLVTRSARLHRKNKEVTKHRGKHRHRHGHHRKTDEGSHPISKTELNSDLAGIYQGKDPKEAIAKFKEDRINEKQLRRQNGNPSVRESLEEEKLDPDDWERINKSVQAMRQPDIPTQSQSSSVLPYDIHDCPWEPGSDYPYSWNVMTVLHNWNPDTVEPELLPPTIYQGVCVFDLNKEGDGQKAENYRKHEVPFVLQNLPEAMRAAERWSTPGYLEELLGDEAMFTEHSRTNHFMFWSTKSPKVDQQQQQSSRDFVPPTDHTDLTYPQWLEKAHQVAKAQRQTKEEHWYLRLNAMLHNHAYVYEELPFFDPTLGKSLTMVTPEDHQGINCRFGMKGTIAEAHYDAYNNFLSILGGSRR
jgi:Cupin-like domain